MNTVFSDYVTGATLASELVNTSPIVRSAGEMLTDPAALGRFLAGHDLDAGDPVTSEDLDSVLALRTEVRDILETADEDRVVAALDELVGRAGRGPVLRRDGRGGWDWHVAIAPDATLADRLAVAIGVGLLGVVHHLGLERFRACSSPACAGVFVDTSRAGRRRYCMPDLCGNRVNVANHRARRAAQASGEPR